ncbi:MAG: DUF5368 domain-containing protein [Thalassovita sp.]
MVAAAVLVTLAYLYVLIRDRSVSWRNFVGAGVYALWGVAAVWFVDGDDQFCLSDIGGPIDVIVFLGVAVMGAIGAAILVYTAESLIKPRRVRPNSANQFSQTDQGAQRFVRPFFCCFQGLY